MEKLTEFSLAVINPPQVTTMNKMVLNTTKCSRLWQMNKKLQDAMHLSDLKHFSRHRALFEKMRQNGGRDAKSDSSQDPGLTVQINSKGKLDEFKEDIQTIDEIHELANESAQQSYPQLN